MEEIKLIIQQLKERKRWRNKVLINGKEKNVLETLITATISRNNETS